MKVAGERGVLSMAGEKHSKEEDCDGLVESAVARATYPHPRRLIEVILQSNLTD